jgi:RNA polymerase sigma factor (sigma-70 family)
MADEPTKLDRLELLELAFTLIPIVARDVEDADMRDEAISAANAKISGMNGVPPHVHNPGDWLWSVIRNAMRDAVRAQVAYRTRHDQLSETYDTPCASDPLDEVLQAETLSESLDLLNRLPCYDRRIILLRDYDGLPFRAIGDRMGCSRTTAYSRYNEAMQRLRTLRIDVWGE